MIILPNGKSATFFYRKYVLPLNDWGDLMGCIQHKGSVKQTADAETAETDEVERDIHCHEKMRT